MKYFTAKNSVFYTSLGVPADMAKLTQDCLAIQLM